MKEGDVTIVVVPGARLGYAWVPLCRGSRAVQHVSGLCVLSLE